MADAAYYRAWRASHPEYRERERHRKRERRHRMTPMERRQDRGRKKPIIHDPLPALHLGSDIFDHAKRLARFSHGYEVWEHPFYDDLIGEIVLALVEGRSPTQARRDFLGREYDWQRNTISLRAWEE